MAYVVRITVRLGMTALYCFSVIIVIRDSISFSKQEVKVVEGILVNIDADNNTSLMPNFSHQICPETITWYN